MNRLSRLDVRAKTLAFALLVAMFLVVDDPVWNSLLLAGLLGCLAGCRAPLRGTMDALRPLLALFALVIVFALFGPARFHHPEHHSVLFSLWGLQATTGGLLVGIDFVLRIVALVVLTAAYVDATPADELLLGLDWAHAPTWLGVLLSTAIAFVPTMTRTKDLILDAQRARGADVRRRGPFGAILSFVPIMIPLLTSAILMATTLSVALTNRGYGASGRMTALRELHWNRSDTMACLVSVLCCALWLYARFGLGMGWV